MSRNNVNRRRDQLILVLGLSFLSFANTAFSSPYIIASVPFNNVILNPKDVIQANYSFKNFPGMLCFDNNLENVGEIKWPYKGNIKSSTLPVLLKVSDLFDGKFADRNGTVTVTNTANKQLVVTCTFG